MQIKNMAISTKMEGRRMLSETQELKLSKKAETLQEKAALIGSVQVTQFTIVQMKHDKSNSNKIENRKI